MQNQERRASGVKRVPVQTLVEICGRAPDVPAFEAESIEVSGRGMHVKTRYLPPVGSPLVLRFEDRGRQILVEGEVSWADSTEHGGEFGIRFTALDSGSVDALRELCAIAPVEQGSSPSAAPEPPEASDAPERTRVPNGARVHLHIDGMGSTMKAQVRRSGGRKMIVGSKLELLKLGRHLSVEDMEAGERVGAVIDTVDVLVDPQSQVPQLIVSLSYDEAYADATPEPSQVLRGAAPTVRAAGAPRDADVVSVTDDKLKVSAGFDPEDEDEPDFDTDDDDGVSAEFDDYEGDEEPSALRSKLGGAAVSAGRIAKNTGEALKHVGASAATRVGSWIKSRRQERNISKQAAPPTLRRQGAGVPSRGAGPSSVYADGRRLRPQSLRGGAEPSRAAPGRAATPPNSTRKIKRYGAIAGAVVLLGTVSVLAMRGPTAEPTEASLSKGVSAETAVLPGDDVTQVDEQGDPITTSAAKGKTTTDGISADVPLFGPTPMATSEAAPVDEGEEGEPLGAAQAVDDTPPVEDEAWDDQPAAKSPAEAPKPAVVDPSKVPPWGRGKVTRPTIHRIRLDGPGGAIQGAINPTGFAVVIPGRKVMEDGAGISKRDKRIARVRTTNTGGGAQITFQFKDGIPGYRVRLRKDFVEFLVSEPAKSGSLAKR